MKTTQYGNKLHIGGNKLFNERIISITYNILNGNVL